MRWFALATLVFLVVLHIKEAKVCGWRGAFKCLGTTFMEGMVGGLIIDAIAFHYGFYYFPRQPAHTLPYWVIVIPCWGVFGSFCHWVWHRIGRETFLRGASITIGVLGMSYEGLNLITHSWVYTVPFYTVALGWIPLILTFVGCNRRRRVVFKFESWAMQFGGNGIWRYSIRALCSGVRFGLIAVMFPLWVFPLAVLGFNILRHIYSLDKEGMDIKTRMWQVMMGSEGVP